MEAALRKVNEAVQTAEKQLDKLDTLPSARMPRQVRMHVHSTHLAWLLSLGHTLPMCSQLLLHLCIKALEANLQLLLQRANVP